MVDSIRIVGFLFEIALWLIMGFGMYTCWRGYRSSKKKAWLVIGVFFFFHLLGVRPQNFTRYFQQAKVEVMSYEERIEMHKKGIEPPSRIQDPDGPGITLPLLPLLLVIGLSLLARQGQQEIEDTQQELSPGPGD